MITKEMYLLAKKVVESYESKQLNIPNVMRCFPTIKQREIEMNKQADNWKWGELDKTNYIQGFLSGYNWVKREFKKNNA